MKKIPKKIAILFVLSANTIFAQTPEQINKFNPQVENTIVVNMKEFPSNINNFLNYAVGFGTPHNNSPKVIRKLSNIKHIVLHETSGSESGTGFDGSRGFTAHFAITNKGISQFNDMVETEFHAGIFNSTSIGIEFANPDWVRVKDSKREYLELNWSDGNHPIYTLPNIDKLERLVEFLQRILSKSEERFPNIQSNWLQLVSYNDVKNYWDFKATDVPLTDDSKTEKKYFIYSSALGYIKPDSMLKSGILSHDCISTLTSIKVNENSQIVVNEDAHTDGSFQSLYSFLRISKAMDRDNAFETAKNLLLNNTIQVKTIKSYEGYNKNLTNRYSGLSKRPVFIINISGIPK
jgi:hypothetical protein